MFTCFVPPYTHTLTLTHSHTDTHTHAHTLMHSHAIHTGSLCQRDEAVWEKLPQDQEGTSSQERDRKLSVTLLL